MKDPRLIALRTRAERDLSLADGAFRLLCRLISEKYVAPHFLPEDEFPLAWPTVARLTGASMRQCYRYIDALVNGPYLRGGTLKGCPPVAQFSFVFDYAKNGRIESAKNGRINSAKNGRINSAEKGRDHIKYPSGKNSQKKETIRARQGRGEGRNGGIERRQPPDVNAARVKRLAADMRKAAS